jgi:hypothetical protein
MPRVSQRCRLDALRKMGLSPRLMDLAAQRWPHKVYRDRCAEPIRCYSVPDELWPDEPLVPLWEDSDAEIVVGCRGTNRARLFFAWYLDEVPKTIEQVTHSEQGLLFWLFMHLMDYNEDWEGAAPASLDTLRAAARVVGFRHLDQLLSLPGHQPYRSEWIRQALEIVRNLPD